jgi:HEPN domain-containing protein
LNTLVNGQNGNGNGNGKHAPKPSRLILWRAERKLAMARAALNADRTAWAWFAAHEAAELAARAIYPSRNGRERMVARLLLHASDYLPVPEAIFRQAAILDSHYIPNQNGHSLVAPETTATRRRPAVTFGNPDAPSSEVAVQAAEDIVAFARFVVRG